MYFFMDGRIKDVVASGPSGTYWDYKRYRPYQNPNRVKSTLVNNTYHLRVRYSPNGTYIMYHSYPYEYSETFNSESDSWQEYFLAHIDSLTVPYFTEEDTYEGHVTYFVNDTKRIVYLEPNLTDRIQTALAPLYADVYNNGTVFKRFRNGTVA